MDRKEPLWHLPAAARPRVVVTTDAEIDDRCSMVRYLLSANAWETCGLIFSSSVFHQKGGGAAPAHDWQGEAWLQRQLDAYATVYPNLVQHDPRYPAPERLRRQVFLGNVTAAGEMAQETPGSRRIVELLLDRNPAPLWLQAWGGANTIARALKTIAERHPERRADVVRKTALFLITEQDRTLRDYILPNWPDLPTLVTEAWPALAYDWQDLMEPERQTFFEGAWMRRNLLEGHGPLCALYEAAGDGRFRSEGDSPAFLHLLARGLGACEHPGYGGWGGRFAWNGTYWTSTGDGRDAYAPILRWAEAFQNDFAARADWSVRPVGRCNHAPQVVCQGDASQRVLHRTVAPGARVRLSARGTHDPDGDRLTYRWWNYREAGDFWHTVAVRNDDTPEAELTTPVEAAGRTIHIVLEVRDSGDPPLTAYRRLVLHVAGKPLPPPPDADRDAAYRNTPLRRLSGPAPAGAWTFFRGVNVNGPAVEIDGNHWDAEDAAGVQRSGNPLRLNGTRLLPETDPARAQMLWSFRYATQMRLTLRDIPAGRYAVYAYFWEDNNPEMFSIALNGRVVVARHFSGEPGEWRRLGPWPVDIRDGILELTTRGGNANLSGLEVWRSR